MGGILGDRFPTTRLMAIVAVGDLVAIALFVAVGERSHGDPISAGVGTALAFVGSWIAVAVLLGAYSPRALDSLRKAAFSAAITWTLAALVGQLVRAVALPDTNLALSFVLVSIVVGGAPLVAWRLIAATWRRSRG